MKKCEACGKTFDDDQKFCDVCGKELVEVADAEVVATEESAPAAKASILDKFKAMDKKTKMICGGVCAAILLILICIICGSGTPKYKGVNRDAISIAYASEDGIAYVYNGNNKVKKLSSDETTYSSLATSMDGKTKVVSVAEKDAKDKTYAVLTIKGLVNIDDELSNAVISTKGATVAYFKDVKNGVGDLYLFNVKSKKSQKIHGDVVTSSVVLSPDGKSLAYTIKDEDSGDLKAVYSKNGKDATTVAKNSNVLAIADGAKFVYYVKTVDDARNLYVMKGKNSVKLADATKMSGNPYFNATCNEIIFNEDGKSYISINGKEKKKISNNTVYTVYTGNNEKETEFNSAAFSYTYSTVKTFKNTIASINGAYYKLSGKYVPNKIISADDVRYVKFSDDLKSCVYLKGDDLYRISNVNKPDKKKKLGEFDDFTISDFVSLTDLNSFYFIADGDLYYKKGTGKPKKIATDAKLAGADYEANGVYYYVEYDSKDTNDLYFSKNGSKKKVAAKAIKGTSVAAGGYRIVNFENKKDDSQKDYYTLKGTSKKKLFTR